MPHANRRSTQASRAATTAQPKDAIALLKADHRQVEQWFDEFDKARSGREEGRPGRTHLRGADRSHHDRRGDLLSGLSRSHWRRGLHHEAEVEHASAKNLIAQIQAAGPEDEYFDAKVTVLSEMIKHHVKEEEQRDGMFAKARASDMDLEVLGQQLFPEKGPRWSRRAAGSARTSAAGLRAESALWRRCRVSRGRRNPLSGLRGDRRVIHARVTGDIFASWSRSIHLAGPSQVNRYRSAGCPHLPSPC